jgi:uroporphyrin-III C-methyltransferase
MKGKVYLVGAGPGDPDLLTMKAVRLLKSAAVVLHDDLVSNEILALISPKAELRNVGKRCGAKRISQTEINFLMIALAESGLDVVRLKSGDPLIFGRGGEEMEALCRAGIEFEVVPGVTAGLAAAAAAQIPLTHRDISHALVFLTENSADGREAADWKKLVASGVTLAIYMPGHDNRALAMRLMDAGVRAETPCAVISRASTGEQRIAVRTVGSMQKGPDLPSPSLFIVGEVVGFAQAFDASHVHLPGALNGELSASMRELGQLMAHEEVA